MQRLRHPIRSIREPFGKAGLTVAILALVFAMVGGAWAAVGLNSKQKKEVTKIAKKYAGKPGAPGAAGTNGTNGTNGTAGAKGDTGAAGAAGGQGIQGIQGIPGTTGKTVLNGTVDPTTGVGTTGDFYINTTTNKIFGPKPSPAGAWPAGVELKGAAGSPWTAGGTLPPGATETGVWGGRSPGDAFFSWSISFPIPLAAPIDIDHTVTVFKTESPVNTNCDNTIAPVPSVTNPEADPGYFCIFEGPFGEIAGQSNVTGEGGAGTTGAIVTAEGDVAKRAFGTFAVTACGTGFPCP